MSSAVVSTSAALGRPFLFDAGVEEEFCHPERSGKCEKRISRGVEGPLLDLETSLDPRLASITPASRLETRPAPDMASSGIPTLDALTGGLPRGCLTELCGPASSGRTSVMLTALAAATRRGEYCALIDASDALDPHSLAAAGVDLDRVLWVRCADLQSEGAPSLSRFVRQGGDFGNNPDRRRKSGITQENSSHLKFQSEHRLEQVLRATDLLLESGGFGLIILDLADVPYQSARRIPLTTWFRFRRAVEHKPTILLAIEQQPIAGSCSSLQLQLGSQKHSERSLASIFLPSHANLFTELEIRAELIRSRLDRKPARSVAFETKTAWAG